MVLVFDNGELKGYVNGKPIGTVTTSFTSIPTHTGDVAIGQKSNDTRFSDTDGSSGDGNYFDGKIVPYLSDKFEIILMRLPLVKV